MRLRFLNGYWTAYSGDQPVVSFASFGEALAASAGVSAKLLHRRCVSIRPPTTASTGSATCGGLRRFQPHEVRCLLSAQNKIYWPLSFDPVTDRSLQQIALPG
jgi:hypothetical protein